MSRRIDPYNHAIRIIQCTLPWCSNWYISNPHDYYCPDHAHCRKRNLNGSKKGKISKLSYEQIMEIRYEYLRKPVAMIAKEFGITSSRVYWLQKNFPRNIRQP